MAFWERMKALNISELDEIVEDLRSIVGARLQDVFVSKRDIVLQFYLAKQGLQWIWVELHPSIPMLLRWDQLPLPLPKATLPFRLFLKSHFLGRSLKEVKREDTYGRVVLLSFADDLKIEVRLFPHGQNATAIAQNKSLHFLKPQSLEPIDSETEVLGARSKDEILTEWVCLRKKKTPTGKTANPAQQLASKIKKTRRAISKIEEDIEKKQAHWWRRTGEWLKNSGQMAGLPADLQPYVDKTKDFSWNLQNCFNKAKSDEQKLTGTLERLAQLKNELQNLTAVKDPGALFPTDKPASLLKKDRKKTTLKTRKARISDQYEVYVGKSASDNIALLRKAKAWDTWLHLKDFPSAHAILFGPKGKATPQSVLLKAAHFLVETFAANKKMIVQGEKIEVLAAECRHVRPIKGDRLGRVQYQQAKVVIVRL